MITHWVVGFHGTRYCSTFTEHLTASCNFLSDDIAKKKEKPSHLFVLVHFISSQGAKDVQERERERHVEPGCMLTGTYLGALCGPALCNQQTFSRR